MGEGTVCGQRRTRQLDKGRDGPRAAARVDVERLYLARRVRRGKTKVPFSVDSKANANITKKKQTADTENKLVVSSGERVVGRGRGGTGDSEV